MESYQETLDWMFSRLPMFQRKGEAAYRPGLEAMEELDGYLKHPHCSFRSIHVGGTNGKGSTSHMIASVLQTAGHRVGLYTSPHLLSFRERIKIDGRMIPREEVSSFISEHKSFFEQKQFSFFEMTVGMAFSYFRKEEVDFAVIEVGMGGRLDATNIIRPILSVITNIGLDHSQFLGTTRPQIAKEKAGIIKENTPLVIGEEDPEIKSLFEKNATQKNAPIFYAKEVLDHHFSTDLKGFYQKENMKTAVLALKNSRIKGLTEAVIQKGLSSVIGNTKIMGRWQKISEKPQVILDVGHNEEGLKMISEQLKSTPYNQLHLVMGFVKGRKIKPLLSCFSNISKFYLSAPQLERALSVEEIKEQLKNTNKEILFFDTVETAFKSAMRATLEGDLILVCGSTFVVAEVLALKNSNKENF